MVAGLLEIGERVEEAERYVLYMYNLQLEYCRCYCRLATYAECKLFWQLGDELTNIEKESFMGGGGPL